MRRKYRAIAAVMLAAVCIPQDAGARKIRTGLPVKKIKTAKEVAEARPPHVITPDSIAIWSATADAVRFYGFDKTVSSTKESFFIVNGLDSLIRGIGVEITYLDMKGRQLHRRREDIDCLIPAGETKRIDIRSWDTQKSFYFHQSVKPKRQATPFDVRIRLTSVNF